MMYTRDAHATQKVEPTQAVAAIRAAGVVPRPTAMSLLALMLATLLLTLFIGLVPRDSVAFASEESAPGVEVEQTEATGDVPEASSLAMEESAGDASLPAEDDLATMESALEDIALVDPAADEPAESGFVAPTPASDADDLDQASPASPDEGDGDAAESPDDVSIPSAAIDEGAATEVTLDDEATQDQQAYQQATQESQRTSEPVESDGSEPLELVDASLAGYGSGENHGLMWDVNGDGVLTIRGGTDNGKTESWYSFANVIKSVVIDMSDGPVILPEDCTMLFSDLVNITTIDLTGLDATYVTSMNGMFKGCKNLVTIKGLDTLETSLLTDMSGMFYECEKLEDITLGTGSFDISKVTDMSLMCYGCTALRYCSISSCSTPSLTNTMNMFRGCSSMSSLYLYELDTSHVYNMTGMFDGVESLSYMQLGKKFSCWGNKVYGANEEPLTYLPKPVLFDKWYSSAEGKAFTAEQISHDRGYKQDEYSLCWDLSKAKITVTPAVVTYTGEFVMPAKIVVTIGDIELTPGTGYEVKVTEKKAFGVINFKIVGKGNTIGSKTGSYRINFLDTPVDAWYVVDGWLDHVVTRQMMTGLKDSSGYTGYFDPEGNVTRAQIAIILYRHANPTSKATSDPAYYGKTSRFSDVPTGMYYTAAIEWCAENGIVTGYGDTGTFGPDDLVTREQLAAMVFRYATRDGGPITMSTAAFALMPDTKDVSGWALQPMVWCVSHGVITGDKSFTPARINPQGNATRAQAAKIITVVTRDIMGK